jgi:CHASE3 domain sensor protein
METAYNHYRRREVEAENNELKQVVKENGKLIGQLITALFVTAIAFLILLLFIVLK